MARRSILAGLAALVVAGCADPASSLRPSFEILDGAHNDGNQHFYFLPPLVRSPAYAGTFDPMVAPEVHICEWSGSACGPLIVSFSITTGAGSEVVRMEPGEEQYVVNWHTDRFDLDSARTYRIRVLVGSQELGHADVDVATSGRGLRNVNTDEYIALLDGQTLPIKFRIEEGALPPGSRHPIAGGFDHSCAIAQGGAAYCWGSNARGQLGDGTIDPSAAPVPVSGGHLFTSVVTGVLYSCGLDTDGAAWCWGYGANGNLGTGANASSPTPVAVVGGHSFSAIAAGRWHTCGLTTAGEALCWGWNFFGQLGAGSSANSSSVPVAVAGGLLLKSLDAGWDHTCAVTTSGAGYCWGNNFWGQLGTGGVTQVPPYGANVPTLVSGGLVLSSVAAGQVHTCALDAVGAAYCWGFNRFGQVGNGSDTPDYPHSVVSPTAVSGGLSFTAISGGSQHTCALSSAGAAWCWGNNRSGELGVGTYPDPVSVAAPVVTIGNDVWAAVDAGLAHTCGITIAGIGKCWGFNGSGELGSGSLGGFSPAPVAIAGGLTFESP